MDSRRENESTLDFFHRICAENEAERQERLTKARAEQGRQPFDYQRFLAGCRNRVQNPPSQQEAEEDYLLRGTQTLQEYIDLLHLGELYDGGDMHLD